MPNSPTTEKLPKIAPKQKKIVETVNSAVDASEGTPSRVIKTFSPSDITISGMKISKCGLGILGLLEEIDHPLIKLAMGEEGVKIGVRDIQRAVYIFADPRGAKNASAVGKLDETAEAWVMENEVPADAVSKLPQIFVGMIEGNFSMIPGAGADREACETNEKLAARPIPVQIVGGDLSAAGGNF